MFFIKLFSRLPMGVLYAFSDLLSFLIYHLFGYSKKVVLANLLLAFPEKTQAQRNQIAREFYTNFTDLIVEILKAITISKHELNRRVSIPAADEAMMMNVVKNQKQSIILLATHHFNWEWASIQASAHFPVVLKPVYKRLSNSFFDGLIYQMRSKLGAIPVEMKQTYKLLTQDESAQELPSTWVLVADQTPSKNQNKYWTSFFNRPTPFFTGAANLPTISQLPVYFIRIKKIKRGYYQYSFELVAEPPYSESPDFSIIDRYAQIVEKAVREQPQTWLWTHRRWKHSPPTENPTS
jgi:Kdo2-lipid IVA lauroyltransferase/acyltransferase